MFICLENKHITGALKLDATFTYKYKRIKELGYQNIKLQWSQRRISRYDLYIHTNHECNI